MSAANPVTEIESWLKRLKREETVLLTARSALRAIPALGQSDRTRLNTQQCLRVFRDVSASWFAGTWPTQMANVAEHMQAPITLRRRPFNQLESRFNSARQDGSLIQQQVEYATSSASLTVAIDEARVARFGAHSIALAQMAIHSSQHVYFGTETVKLDLSALTEDQILLQASNASTFVSDKPIWPKNVAPQKFVGMWEDLATRLLDEGEDWEVWTDWYEDRLRGTPAKMELERARVLIPNEDWEKGPAHVNAIIKRLIEEHQPSLKTLAARRIAEQPKAAAASAEVERARLEERLADLRASLPNEPEELERAREEIAKIEEMQRDLETVATTTDEPEVAGQAVESLAGKLKTWVEEYLTKDRANAAADALVLGGLVAFLVWCGMPEWLAGSYLIARLSGFDVIQKIKELLKGRDE